MTIGKHGKVHSALRFVLRTYYNLIFPIQCRFKKDVVLSGKDNVIVSLTTFPTRINKVWMVIESILQQTTKPDKIVLTLSELQFKNRKIPRKLSLLQERGLEIIWTDDDIRSHKKYYYVMQKYPKAVIITIDDDIIYEKSLLSTLLYHHSLHPTCILCNWGSLKIGVNYNNWKNLLFEPAPASESVLQIGVGGVLYPPGSLHQDALRKDIFLTICPSADDIWLNAMAILKGTQIVKTDYRFYYIPIMYKNNLELNTVNVGGSQNNVQIQALLKYYGNNLADNFIPQ